MNNQVHNAKYKVNIIITMNICYAHLQCLDSPWIVPVSCTSPYILKIPGKVTVLNKSLMILVLYPSQSLPIQPY